MRYNSSVKTRPKSNEQETPIIMVQQDMGGIPTLGFDQNVSADPRSIWLSTEVYPETITPVVQQILDINYQDTQREREAELEGQTYVRHPIKLFVSSYGGSVYDGFGLIGVIKSSKTPIHTYTVGKVMSMGFLIAISGHKRFAYDYSSYMYHSISSAAWGKFAELQESAEEVARLQNIADNIVIERTTLTPQLIEDIHSRKLDWYIGAQEAYEFSCVDEVI